jgi:hypothetical protein
MNKKKTKKSTTKAVKKTAKIAKPIKPAKTVKKVKVSTDNTLKSKVMTCIVTGIEKRVSKLGVAKGIKKFGDINAFIDNYISNEAKKLLRQRISPEEVQKQLRPKDMKPFEIDHKVLARQKLLKKPRHKKLSEAEATLTVKNWKPAERRTYSTLAEYVVDNTKNGSCIAPQLYLDYDRCCDECKYTQWCQSTAKQFSKHYKK